MNQSGTEKRTAESGRSIIETLVVLVIVGILTAVAIPQLLSARRLIRSSALPREVATQLRFAKQSAMSQRQAFTFQYDNTNKSITIIDHNNNENPNVSCNISGAAIMSAAGYPNTACSRVVLTVPLTGRIVLPANELSFGVPSGVVVSALADGTTPTALASGKLTVTFQPDGSVINTSGNFTNRTLFFYNNVVPQETASAISVLGASGRIKVWRLNTNGNVYSE
jgi:Tfp pilus assembly protein FimT